MADDFVFKLYLLFIIQIKHVPTREEIQKAGGVQYVFKKLMMESELMLVIPIIFKNRSRKGKMDKIIKTEA